MKNIIVILLLFTVFLSCNRNEIKYYVPSSMKPNISPYDEIIFMSNDSTLKDTFSYYQESFFDPTDNKGNYYERFIFHYFSKDKNFNFLERYNPNLDLIKKNVEFSYYSNSCVFCCEYMKGEYLRNYQIGNIIYKDVIKYTNSNCMKEVYYDVHIGLISYKDSKNHVFTYYKSI